MRSITSLESSGPLGASGNFSFKDVTGWGAVRYHDHTPQWVGAEVNRISIGERLGILGSQATEKRCGGRTVGIAVVSAMAPRDTFTGVGVGRKAGSEAGEAIRWGHSFGQVEHAARDGKTDRVSRAMTPSRAPKTVDYRLRRN